MGIFFLNAVSVQNSNCVERTA